MAKRGSNIYKRKDGRYEGRVTVGYDENNKIKYKYIYGKTLSEVKEKMSQAYSNKEHLLKSKNKLTVRELGEMWLNEKKITIKASTFSIYSSLLNNHIYAYLGGMRYTALTKQKINEFVTNLLAHGKLDGKNKTSPKNEKLDRKSDLFLESEKTNKSGGLSPKTVRDIITVLKAISSYAHTEYGLENVCENIKLPKSEYKKIQVLSHEERRVLEQFLRTNLDITNVCVLLCLYTGIRIGELCALQWRDIDLESANISISKTMQRISVDKGKTSNGITGNVKTSNKKNGDGKTGDVKTSNNKTENIKTGDENTKK